MRTYPGDVNSASGENLKESSTSTISTKASFNGDSNEETLNVKKIMAIIENKRDIKYIQILAASTEGAPKNNWEGLIKLKSN